MPVTIRGNEYFTVAERIAMIHEKYPRNVSILTEIDRLVEPEEGPREVIAKATVVIHEGKHRVENEEGEAVCVDLPLQTFTNYAHEVEDLKNRNSPNATSWLEVAMTSAIGRALASAGFVGGEFASAEEVQQALKRGAKAEGYITPEQRTMFFSFLRDTYDMAGEDKERISSALRTAGITKDEKKGVEPMQLVTALMQLKLSEGKGEEEEEGSEEGGNDNEQPF